MRTKIFQIGMLAGLCIGMAACSSDDDVTIEKAVGAHQPIQLSTNLNSTASVITRAAHGFGAATLMNIKLTSTYGSNTSTKDLTATAAEAATADNSAITFATQPYWDEYYGYNANLNIKATAIIGNTNATYADAPTMDNASFSYSLSYSQTGDYINTHDYVYANVDGQTYNSTNKSFPTINLPFKHATSKMTINIIKGDGQIDLSESNVSVTLPSFSANETYNWSTGEYTPASASGETLSPAYISGDASALKYQALLAPGQTMGSGVGMNVTVDGYTYSVIREAMVPTGTTKLQAGYNYTVNVTLSKLGATVKTYVTDYDNTDVALTPVIANTTNLGSSSVPSSYLNVDNFTLYRSTEVAKNYGDASTATYNSTTKSFTYSPTLYWPDQTTSYYFRAVKGMMTDESLVNNDGEDTYIAAKAYIVTPAKIQANGSWYGDLCIGAAYNSDMTLAGSTTATNGAIDLAFKHMKTMVSFEINTSSTDADNVSNNDLQNSTLTLHNVIQTGKFMFGDLSLTDAGAKGDLDLPSYYYDKDRQCVFLAFMLPQNLNEVGNKVTLTLTLKNGNKYNVDISNLTGLSPNKGQSLAIDQWTSNEQINYKITLKRTGANVTATLLNWDDAGTSTPTVHL
jgi:hypothetical protein